MEFRPMRRARQQLSEEECLAVLARNTSGVLAVLGDGGYPYAVPLSYVWHGGALYFHCARSGHKLDAIRACEKASFCVVDQDQVVPERFTTHFRSVIVFGRAAILEDGPEFRAAIDALALKYAPGSAPEDRAAEIQKELPALCMVKLQPERITGKEARELAQQRTESSRP